VYRRAITDTLAARLAEPRRFIQAVVGARQVGKTTGVLQVLEDLEITNVYASADEPGLRGAGWLEQQWEHARLMARGRSSCVLALDEVHKVPGWSETVKRLWDEDKRSGLDLRVCLLGSSSLLMTQGLTESLAGRFELLRATHWLYQECREAFGWDADTYLFHGGYPGAAGLVGDYARWRAYVLDSLVETTVSRDILLLARVDKPALLRQLFFLAAEQSGQVLSFTKMLGRLQDAGNTTTLAHYLDLLEQAGLVRGLSKFSGSQVRRRASMPKLLVLNTGLLSAVDGRNLEEARADRRHWGRLVESAVGAHLHAVYQGQGPGLYYWRDGDYEVDYVLEGRDLWAIEVKSGGPPASLPGMDRFARRFGKARKLLVGEGGLGLEEFLLGRLE
jgi:predicted AAA+ superfamily ATPase